MTSLNIGSFGAFFCLLLVAGKGHIFLDDTVAP